MKRQHMSRPLRRAAKVVIPLFLSFLPLTGPAEAAREGTAPAGLREVGGVLRVSEIRADINTSAAPNAAVNSSAVARAAAANANAANVASSVSPSVSPTAIPTAIPGAISNVPSDPGSLCLDAAHRAAQKHGIPPQLMVAITLVETRQPKKRKGPWPWTLNIGGKGYWLASRDEALALAERAFVAGRRSVDLGCFQINFRWHGEHFVNAAAMLDPAISADYAARFLTDLYRESGNWLRAAGHYHSRTPHHAHRYAGLVRRTLARLRTQANSPAPASAPAVAMPATTARTKTALAPTTQASTTQTSSTQAPSTQARSTQEIAATKAAPDASFPAPASTRPPRALIRIVARDPARNSSNTLTSTPGLGLGLVPGSSPISPAISPPTTPPGMAPGAVMLKIFVRPARPLLMAPIADGAGFKP